MVISTVSLSQTFRVLGAELCPPPTSQIYVLKPQTSVPQTITIVGGKVFKKVTHEVKMRL